MKKILLTVAMLLSAAGLQAAAQSGPQQLAIKNFRAPVDSDMHYNEPNQSVFLIPIDKNSPQQIRVIKQGEPIPQGWRLL